MLHVPYGSQRPYIWRQVSYTALMAAWPPSPAIMTEGMTGWQLACLASRVSHVLTLANTGYTGWKPSNKAALASGAQDAQACPHRNRPHSSCWGGLACCCGMMASQRPSSRRGLSQELIKGDVGPTQRAGRAAVLPGQQALQVVVVAAGRPDLRILCSTALHEWRLLCSS